MVAATFSITQGAVAEPIAPMNLSVVTSPSPDEDIARAIELWEQANELLLSAGRMFANVKEETKRKFNKFVESASLEKSQVSKLIKAAECASEVPSSVVARLGMPMLLQLSQPRSQTAREAIAPSDTQTLVAQKIKELRKPAVPKEEKPVRFVGNQKGGVGKLRIEVPGCPEALQLERDWVESGLPPLQWLEKRVREEAAPTDDQAAAPAMPSDEQVAAVVEEAIVTDEQTVAQTEIERYIEELTLECDLVEAIATQDQAAASTRVFVMSEQTTNQCDARATATERYKFGWNVGDSAVANNVGGEYFVRWCNCQPVRIESVSGNVGEIQILRVARHDGLTDMSFGNWLESVPELLQTKVFECVPKIETEEATQTETLDYAKLSKTLLRAKNWEKVSELVQRNGEILSEAIANWSIEQKEEILRSAIAYIEANPTAIRYHEVDWMPLDELKQVFHKLSFKVHDITSGLASPWHEECEFVDVSSLGNDDDEVWRFTSGGQEIQVWSREDFEVVAF